MRRRSRFVGFALFGGLLATACGGSGSSGSETQATVDPGVKEGIGQAFGGGQTPANGSGSSTTAASAIPKTLAEWDALGDRERATIVKKIKDSKWGKSADGKTLTGPAGFTIDLSKCPGGWSETEGVTDDQVKIGHTTALSGPAGDFGNGARAMEVIFDYYSKKDVFTDHGKTRKVNLIVKDDGYDAARTIPLVDELIDSEKVFAMWTLGSPTGLKVYDKLNQRCIPHPLEPTGHPAWADPVNHPWTTGLQLAYSTEAVLWGAFIDQHIGEFPTDRKVKIASLVANSDYGKAYDTGFRAYIAQSPNKDRFEYFNEVADVGAPTIKDPLTTIGSKQPDVFIMMSGGVQCTQVIQEVAQNGMKEKTKYLFTSQNCKSASYVGKDKVGGDGSASNGWWIGGGGIRDLNSPSEDGNPYIQWGRQLLESKGINYRASGNFGLGFEYAYPMIQAIRIAGELDGGLTRSNLILAFRSMDLTHPMLLPGIKFNMNGNADAYFIEGSDISRYDSAKQQWVQQGDVIDLSGKTKPCAFDQSTSTCK
jgi:branched-chain amino acid transport system substrate-binding protein